MNVDQQEKMVNVSNGLPHTLVHCLGSQNCPEGQIINPPGWYRSTPYHAIMTILSNEVWLAYPPESSHAVEKASSQRASSETQRSDAIRCDQMPLHVVAISMFKLRLPSWCPQDQVHDDQLQVRSSFHDLLDEPEEDLRL